MKTILYSANHRHEPSQKFKSLWIDALIEEVAQIRQGSNGFMNDDEIYELIIKLNSGLKIENAIKLKEKIDAEPDYAAKFLVEEKGEIKLPGILPQIKYVQRDIGPVYLPDHLRAKLKGNLDIIKNWDSEGENKPFSNLLIIGEWGVGKTTTLNETAKEILKANPDVLVFDMNRLGEIDRYSHGDNSILSAIKSIRAYSSVSNLPCVILWDEITEKISNNRSGSLDRDNLLTELKSILGGSQAVPNLWIIGVGNGSARDINPAFLTEKRFGRRPALIENNYEMQYGVAELYLKHHGVKFRKNDLSNLLKSYPGHVTPETIVHLINEVYTSLDPDERGFNYFAEKLTETLIGDITEDLTRKNLNERIEYLAGAITVALALKEDLFAATIESTTESKLPSLYYGGEVQTLRHSINELLILAGGFLSLESGETDIFDSSLYLDVRSRVTGASQGLISMGISTHGLDTISGSRNEANRVHISVQERTLNESLTYVKKILVENSEIYQQVCNLLSEEPTLYPSDVELLVADSKIVSFDTQYVRDSSSPQVYSGNVSGRTLGFIKS